MTCTGFLINKKSVYAFSDSAAYNGSIKQYVVYPKFFNVGGIWFAYTSSFRMADILQYQLDLPKRFPNTSDIEYIKKNVMEKIRLALKDNGFTKITNNNETIGTFLILYNNKVYSISDDLQCILLKKDIYVVGCGDECMTASFLASDKKDIMKTLKRCLKITSKISYGVEPPFFIKKIK
jgi:hypothetical protein